MQYNPNPSPTGQYYIYDADYMTEEGPFDSIKEAKRWVRENMMAGAFFHLVKTVQLGNGVA